ncbi:MAG: ABC transporter permease [Deltaproteobacteria bacterium]|nr:ABC transporter permease [Deltaproteobacteria bacterium]
MNLRDIAVRNLMRRKGKAAFILAGLVVGVAAVVGVIHFGTAMTTDINHKLEKYGANILIVPRTDRLSLTYSGISLGGVSFEMSEIRETDLSKIHTIENAANIAAVGPIVLGAVSVRSRQVLLAGVDFEAVPMLKPWWKISGQVPGPDQVLVGSEAARILDVRRGQVLRVRGKPVTVSGTLVPTGSQDDRLLFTRIETAQEVLDKPGRVSMVEVAALCSACPVEEMVAQIAEVLPGAEVMAIQQVVKGRMETLSQIKTFSYGISAVVVLVGGLVVLVTLMGSVRERTREIGIFRAVGFRRGHVMRIVFLETALISAFAGFAGYLVGVAGSHVGLGFFSPGGSPGAWLDPSLALGAMLMSVTVGMAAGAYPAFMAARMDPNDALRAM